MLKDAFICNRGTLMIDDSYKARMSGKKLIIFDLDGTLLNTLGDLAASTTWTARSTIPGKATSTVCAWPRKGSEDTISLTRTSLCA